MLDEVAHDPMLLGFANRDGKVLEQLRASRRVRKLGVELDSCQELESASRTKDQLRRGKE